MGLILPPIVDPSPIAGLEFFDDFLGATYDNETWALVGGVTVVPQNAIGGRVLISTAGGTLSTNTVSFFSAANRAQVKWDGVLTQGTGTAECGLMIVAGSEWMCWIATGGFFQCQCGTGGGTTTVSSTVAVDANDHIFEIMLSTGNAQFFLDGVYRTNIGSNVSAGLLQPYVWLTGTGSFNADYVLVQGDR